MFCRTMYKIEDLPDYSKTRGLSSVAFRRATRNGPELDMAGIFALAIRY